MRRFWGNVLAIAFKETRVLRNDTAVVVMMVLQPIIMTLLFGGVVSNTPAHTPWAVLDRSDTETSRRLVSSIQTTGYFVPPRVVFSYAVSGSLPSRRSCTVARSRAASRSNVSGTTSTATARPRSRSASPSA